MAEKKKKKRKKKRYFFKFLIFVLFCIGMYYFLTSEIFDVDDILVENNIYYTAEQLKEMTEIQTGTNIFSIKAGNIKDKLLVDPYIENVEIEKKYPSTVVVTVTERKEVATIAYAGEFIILDSKGLVLKKTSNEPEFLTFEGLTVVKAEVGQALEVEENAMLNDTLKMVEHLENSQLFFEKIYISNVVTRAYLNDYFVCEGAPENLSTAIQNGELEKTINELYQSGAERGTVKVGSDNYFAFNPMNDPLIESEVAPNTAVDETLEMTPEVE